MQSIYSNKRLDKQSIPWLFSNMHKYTASVGLTVAMMNSAHHAVVLVYKGPLVAQSLLLLSTRKSSSIYILKLLTLGRNPRTGSFFRDRDNRYGAKVPMSS